MREAARSCGERANRKAKKVAKMELSGQQCQLSETEKCTQAKSQMFHPDRGGQTVKEGSCGLLRTHQLDTLIDSHATTVISTILKSKYVHLLMMDLYAKINTLNRLGLALATQIKFDLLIVIFGHVK